MIVSSASADPRTCSAYPRWRGRRSVSSSSSVMPITPFIGVRISWLMLARKVDFICEAASAASRAAASSCSSATRASRCRASTKVSDATTPMNASASITRSCGDW